MRREGVGVALLQETHLLKKEHEKLKRQGFNQVYFSSYNTGYIMVSQKIAVEKLLEISDKQGRCVLIKRRLEGELVTILNVYAPQAQTGYFTGNCLIKWYQRQHYNLGRGPKYQTKPKA